MNNSLYWCSTCDVAVPASTVTHHTSVRPGRDHQVGERSTTDLAERPQAEQDVENAVLPAAITVTDVVRHEWKLLPNNPRNQQWVPPGRYLTVTDTATGRDLAEVKILLADNRDGDDIYPLVNAVMHRALEAVYVQATAPDIAGDIARSAATAHG